MRVDNNLMKETLSILQSLGFQTFLSVGKKSSFDILAKKGNNLILIKVLTNIDGLKETQAKSLKCIANRLNASALIVGERTKRYKLEEDVVYERYELYAVNPRTLERALRGEMPKKKFWKGRLVVRLDDKTLSGITDDDVEKVASVLGVSKEAVYMYKKGMGIEAKRAERLAKEYSVGLKSYNIFIPPEAEDMPIKGYLEDLKKLGFDIIPAYSGFDAIAQEREKLVVAKKSVITHETTEYLKRAGKFLNGHPLLVSNRKEESVDNVPIVREDEIRQAKRTKDILKLVEEREGK